MRNMVEREVLPAAGYRNVDEIEHRALTAIGGVSLSTTLRVVSLPQVGDEEIR